MIRENKDRIMERIRYLEPQEKQKTRSMYEKIFSEDSEEFVDYYYEWKTRENEILVMEESGVIQVMMHLNPYTLWMNGHLRKLPYIVAVATEPDCRRQGKMERVMEWALQDLAKQQVPFTFLLPADPAYYYGQGFVFFPCQDSEEPISLQAAETKERFPWKLRWQKAESADIPEMVEFSNNILEERYHIFVKRDAHYYQRLFAETKTEHGGILLLKPQGEAVLQRSVKGNAGSGIKGILVYGVEQQKAEVQELLLEADAAGQGAWCKDALPGLEIAFSKFPMMMRAANLREFVSLIKCEKPCCYDIKIKDRMIPSNCGCFRIEISEDGGRMQEIPEKKIKRELDIQEFSQMLLKDTLVYLKEWV